MKSRAIIGTVATLLFAKQFVTINKLEFKYPYISQPNNKTYQNQNSKQINFKQNSYILSIKTPQLFSEKFDDLLDNDLVLCQNPKGQYVFKIVGAISRNYTPFENGISNLIPPGFVFLIDPVKKQVGMENIAIISSKRHLSLGKFEAWWNKLYKKEQEKSILTNQQQSLERQILQRNNVRQQIRQAQVFRNENIQNQN